MIQTKRVFEVGSDEWKAVTLESPDGIAVVGAIGLAFSDANVKGRFTVTTKGGESYLTHPANVELLPGLLILEHRTHADRHVGGFRPVTAAIPFSAVDGISYEKPE